MFGKDYSKEINDLVESHNKLVKTLDINIITLNRLQDSLASLQESVIKIIKIQNQHKEMVSFIINNMSVDADKAEEVQKALLKMLSNIRKAEEEK